MSGVGFVFWGLFVVFGIIVAAYVVWMHWVERSWQEWCCPYRPCC